MLHPWKWFRENVKTTITADFGGDLKVCTTKGYGVVPGWFKYNRFDGVYDTDYIEFWEASAFHDWCCVELKAGRAILGIEGQVLVYDQEGADGEFFLLMLRAAQRVFMRLISEGKHRSEATKVCRELVKRALVYHKGVRFWDRWAQRLGFRSKGVSDAAI